MYLGQTEIRTTNIKQVSVIWGFGFLPIGIHRDSSRREHPHTVRPLDKPGRLVLRVPASDRWWRNHCAHTTPTPEQTDTISQSKQTVYNILLKI